MLEPEFTEIELPICHIDGDRTAIEVVEVVCLDAHRFRLLCSPGMVEGLARDDIIELSESDPRGFVVISRGGYLCVWFYFQEQGRNRGPDGDQVRAAVTEFGGIFDGGGNTNLVFAIPMTLGFPAVEALFKDLVARYQGSSWLYGNVYDPCNEFKPLGWWELNQ